MAQATVSIRLGNNYNNIQLAVSTNENLSNPIYTSSYASTNRTVKITIDNLADNTRYYYGVVINGNLQSGGRGSFRTFPNNAANFKVAFASCAETGSNHEVFTHIKNADPNMFIHMGDFHYSDIDTNNIELYRTAYDNVFSAVNQATLYANIPTAYMWDDHDFGNNNSVGTNPAKNSAALAYRERVPHYPLAEGIGAKPIYQSFVLGRVRFIMTDLRFDKKLPSLTDNETKTMMSEDQIQWFFEELIKPEPFKIWVNTVPWIVAQGVDSDSWGGYTTERKRIANYIKSKGLVNKIAIISGDMHALAMDDGTNSDFADDGGAPIPVFQAASLDRLASTKGGPYIWGPITNGTGGNQYGIMNVTDNGGNSIGVEWLAMRGDQVLYTYSFQANGIPIEESDDTPPNNPTNLAIAEVGDTTATLSWTHSNSPDLASYDIYDGTTFIGNTAENSYTITNLRKQTTYVFTVKAKDLQGNVSRGVNVEVTTTGISPHLSMNGTSDRLVTPAISFDEVIIEMSAEPISSTRYIDASNSLTYGDIQRYSDGTDRVGSGFKEVHVNGIKVTTATVFIPSNTKITLKAIALPERKVSGGGTVSIFSRASNANFTKGKLYDVKFYNAGELVVHYDLSSGNVQDKSGNNNHGTLTGGTWIS